MKAFATLCLATCVACQRDATSIAVASATPPAPPFSRLDGHRVNLLPSGASLELPASWFTWNEHHEGFFFSRSELEGAREAAGEWDREYAAVANAVIPFESCALQAGVDGWGTKGAGFCDLQMRVYAGQFDPTAVRSAALGAGRQAAEAFFRPVSTSVSEQGPWSTTLLSWDAWYFDYGARANVEFLAARHEGLTVVFVFMFSDCYAGNDPEQILSSFSWP